MGAMVHLEFLVEDQSGRAALEILVPRMLGPASTYRIHSYKGVGRLPRGLRPKSDADKRILLDQLPRVLRGYGSDPGRQIVVVICDLDDKSRPEFLAELNQMLDRCTPRPRITLFCLAIEEFEAWYLGDLAAVRKAYPRANARVLESYVNDSICGTWEVLADATYPGGSKALARLGWSAEGEQKSIWARMISPHMDIDGNRSPSFRYLCERVRAVAAGES